MSSNEYNDRVRDRLCQAAVAIDEAIHELVNHNVPIPTSLHKELCDACDDYLAGEELPRNRK